EFGEGGAQVDRRCRLADAALLVAQRHDAGRTMFLDRLWLRNRPARAGHGGVEHLGNRGQPAGPDGFLLRLDIRGRVRAVIRTSDGGTQAVDVEQRGVRPACRHTHETANPSVGEALSRFLAVTLYR